MAKTFLVGLFFAVRVLCRYWTRYQKQLTDHINASSASAEQKAAMIALLNSAVELCAEFQVIAGY